MEARAGVIAVLLVRRAIGVVEEVDYRNTSAQGKHMILGLVGDRETPIRFHDTPKGMDPESKLSVNLADNSPEAAKRMHRLRLPHHCKPALPSSDPVSNTCNIREKNIRARLRPRRGQTRGFRVYGGDPV